MVDCIHGDILAMALQITQGVLPVVEEMPEGSEKDYVRVSLQTPLTPTVSKTPLRETEATEEEKKASSGVRLNFEETETKKALRFEESEKKKEEFEGPRPYLYLSDAHVEAMLIHWVGPRSVDAATKFMEGITMPSDCTLNDVTAAGEYLMRWKEAMRWCSAHLPHRKTIVTTFIDGIYPKALGESIRKRHFKELKECTIEFMKKYQDAVDAKESLKDIEAELRQEKKKSEDRKTGRVPAAPVPPTVARETAKNQTAAAAPAANVVQEAKDWTTRATCYRCGVYGHISTACPSLKTDEKPPATPSKKLSVMRTAGARSEGPYLSIELAQQHGDGNVLGMTALLDTLAELDGVGKNWLPHLEAGDGKVVHLRSPQRIHWSDPSVYRETSTKVVVSVKVAGSAVEFEESFFVFPWTTDEAILGYDTIRRHNLFRELGKQREDMGTKRAAERQRVAEERAAEQQRVAEEEERARSAATEQQSGEQLGEVSPLVLCASGNGTGAAGFRSGPWGARGVGPPAPILKIGALRGGKRVEQAKDPPEPAMGERAERKSPVNDFADIDADLDGSSFWAEMKKPLVIPAGRKDPPGSGTSEYGSEEARGEPPWTVVRGRSGLRGKSERSSKRWT